MFKHLALLAARAGLSTAAAAQTAPSSSVVIFGLLDLSVVQLKSGYRLGED